MKYGKKVSLAKNLPPVDPCLHYFSTDVTLRAGYIAAEVKHDFLFDTQMSLGRETSAEKSGL